MTDTQGHGLIRQQAETIKTLTREKNDLLDVFKALSLVDVLPPEAYKFRVDFVIKAQIKDTKEK